MTLDAGATNGVSIAGVSPGSECRPAPRALSVLIESEPGSNLLF
jgi:hypothetical protein